MQKIIDKYIDRIKTDYPEDDKIQIDLEQFLIEALQQRAETASAVDTIVIKNGANDVR
tara:strand:+ start:3077 stop:3250 length:174 start_codon:yes stop_codon:yes gene_type:complete